MRVINSAVCLAERNGYPGVKVLWKKDSGMNASFTDLFEPIPAIQVIENKFLMPYYFYSRKKLYHGYAYYDDQSVLRKRFNENYWSHHHENVVLNTCYDFYDPVADNNFFSLFRPIARIRKKIAEITKEFTDEWVGIHIRRTDHLVAREKSTTDGFIHRMDELLEKSSGTRFYLSTDDPLTDSQLRKRYGSRIGSQGGKNLSRDNLAGMEDAVTDMFCLSHTKCIIGSCLSSFGEVASAIGKIPLEIIAKK